MSQLYKGAWTCRLHEIGYISLKKKTKLLRLTTRDAAPESYQVGPESLETFKPLPIKQGEKRKQCHPKLDFRRISQPKTQ